MREQAMILVLTETIEFIFYVGDGFVVSYSEIIVTVVVIL